MKSTPSMLPNLGILSVDNEYSASFMVSFGVQASEVCVMCLKIDSVSIRHTRDRPALQTPSDMAAMHPDSIETLGRQVKGLIFGNFSHFNGLTVENFRCPKHS